LYIDVPLQRVKLSPMTKYTIIVKVDNEQFIKYRNVTDLIRLTAHLDTRFPTWRYFNVYDKNREQIGSFTNRSKPTSKHI